MRLHQSLLTAAVLAMALAGCTLPDSYKQIQGTNPQTQSTNPLGTTAINGTGWGTSSYNDYRSDYRSSPGSAVRAPSDF
ncbi:MAG TPA: hypothetical protein VL135_13780 [Terracidiphilus sp.]|jgi:hypothetical protein|nr:hypothetical protein [Terracidiphilus sp.]